MVGFRPFALALVLLALLPASAAANSTTEIIIKRDPGLSAAERRDIRADAQVRLVETLSLPRTELVTARPGDVKDALRDLEADPDVAYAQLNHRRTAFDDPAMEKQWGIRNVAQVLFPDELDSRGIYDADSDVTEAWAQNVTGAGQTVAIVDSGIADHPDIDPSRVEKHNFVTGETSPDDGDGHGTHVAGIIGATLGNTIGSAGVAPDADLMVLRALDDEGSGTDDDIAAALNYAGDHGAKIVNVSLGGEGDAPLIEDAIEAHPNTLFVIAAGNDGRDNDVVHTYPCDLDDANIICVGASTNEDTRADFSNYSDESVDLFAPGDWIVSTYLGGGYQFIGGTSMAAPHVAATAALALEANPLLTTAQLKGALLNTAEPKPAFAGRSVTGGRLNAAIAVAHVFGTEDDTDGDTVIDVIDACPNDIAPDPGLPEGCPIPDQDADTVADWYDNCDDDDNPDQADLDQDDLGDICDTDVDGDNLQNQADNCPNVANPSQRDRPDGDGQGDACDSDRDNDGVANSGDACPETYAPGTSNGCIPSNPPPPGPPPPPADSDRDGMADVSDACPGVPAATPNGCPLAQVAGVSTRVRKRGKRRSATIRVATSDVATLRITVERKKGRRWVRVTRRTLVTSRDLATLTVSRLKRGSHRVRISISNSAGSGTAVTKSFRVR
jgi:subtilisin family serine protease